MKKLLAILLLISANAHAADFIDTLGAECGKILFNISLTKFPSDEEFSPKNTNQFDALKKCLDLYKENGGSIEELNKRYQLADKIFSKEVEQIIKSETNNNYSEDKLHRSLSYIEFEDNLKNKRINILDREIWIFDDTHNHKYLTQKTLKEVFSTKELEIFNINSETKESWYKRLFKKDK